MQRLLNKFTLLAWAILAISYNANGQKTPTEKEYMRGKVMVGHTLFDTAHATPGQMAFYQKHVRLNKLANQHYYFNWLGKQELGIRFDANVKSNIYEGLKQPHNGREFTSILIDGSTSVEIIDQNINSKARALNYLYRVTKNNNEELLGWTQPSNIQTTKDGSGSYAYLGKFNYVPNQFIRVEIYNIHKFSDQDAVFIDWRPVEAAKVFGHIEYASTRFNQYNGYFSKSMKDLQQTQERYFKNDNGKPVMAYRPVTVKDFIETTSKDDIRFRADDSVQNLTFSIPNGKKLYNYQINLKRNTAQHRDSINLGESNENYILNKEYWKTPGRYQIIFTPKICKPGGHPVSLIRSKATGISFTVLPALNQQQTVSVRFLSLLLVIILTTAGFMFMMYRRQQKRKLAKSSQNRKIALLQLQAVRSQLNPHFVFNALAGIQNLMHKNEPEQANKYLSKFAKLTRHVLDNSSKELTAIENETELLNDYLQMEQMRFGFQFSIRVNEKETDEQVEIPAMLLQPFAENAVKHGVSALKDAGIIEIMIAQKGNNLLLTVKDNGKGFNTEASGGMGIKLCKERIALLNSIYKDSHIEMHCQTNSNGTLITIELQNWI